MSPDPALERYFQEASSWDADRAAMNARSVRTAWRVAIGACALAGVAMVALMLIMPLKHVERSEKNLQRFLSVKRAAPLSLQPSYHLALPSDDALGFGDLLSGNREIACVAIRRACKNLSSEGILPCPYADNA